MLSSHDQCRKVENMSITILNRKKIKNARVVLTREGKRSLIGRDWLAQLNFRVGESHKIVVYNNAANNITSQNITKNTFKVIYKTKKNKRVSNKN